VAKSHRRQVRLEGCVHVSDKGVDVHKRLILRRSHRPSLRQFLIASLTLVYVRGKRSHVGKRV